MNFTLTPSTSPAPLGDPSNRRLLRLESGPYAQRLVALMLTEPNTVSLVWSDNPYSSQSTLFTVASDVADSPFDCCLDPSGNIWVIYSQQSTTDLVGRQITFANGACSVGAAVTISNGGQCHSPSVAVEPGGKLWVVFARYAAPNRTYYCKSSSDGGATWGTGPSDPGEIVSDPAVFLNARLLCSANDLFLILAYGDNRITYRTRSLGGSSWSAETSLASSANISTDFDASLSPSGAVGLAFLDSTQLRYREFDGVTWSPAVNLANPGSVPQVVFRGESPVVIFLAPFEGAQTQLTYVYRSGTSFTAPAPLDLRSRTFDGVILYDQTSGSYSDLSVAAANAATADVYHPSSFALVKNVGDALFLGMDLPFRYVQANLFTPGAGGTVAYSYWNGSSWIPFTPSGGISHLTAAASRIVLWNDYTSIPVDWQKSSVGAQNRFWIRLDVTSAYTVSPIASRVSAISESTAVCCARN